MRPIIFILLFCVLASCKKTTHNSPTPTPIPGYDFSWAYTSNIPSYTGIVEFSFTSTALSGSKLAWNFGDGDTSSGATPSHIYPSSGTFTVSLVVDGNTTNTIKKVLNVGAFLPHNFSVSGVPFTDSIVFFHSNVLPDSSFLWEFNDGTTSTDSVPTHVFHNPGIYNVRLTVNGNTSTAVTIPVNICNDPLYSHLVAGVRLWHDTLRFQSTGVTTVYPRPDVSFALTYINAAQIAYGSRVMYYSPYGSRDSLLYFQSSYTDRDGHPHSISVSFNPYLNSINMQQFDRLSPGGANDENWNTP